MPLFQKKMVAKPLTTEFVALTEKKMDMTLGLFFLLHTYNTFIYKDPFWYILCWCSQMI